jgi:NADPH-dependent curcumin reductase CurA
MNDGGAHGRELDYDEHCRLLDELADAGCLWLLYTGGEIFETCLFAMKNFGRIACCGAVSQYDGAPPPHGPRGIPGLIVTKRLTLRGFVVMDFDDQRESAGDLQAGWSGQLKVREDIIDGLENLQGPNRTVGGENRGKRMIRV